jgi:hypothetical protein
MPASRFWLMHAAIVSVSAGLLVLIAMRALVAEPATEPEPAA